MDDQTKQRIEQLKVYLGLNSDRSFALFVGISPPNYSKIMSGGRDFGTSALNKICIATGASKEWILHGRGEMIDKSRQQPKGQSQDVSKLIELMSKQQEHIASLMAEIERKNQLIEFLRVEINQRHP